MNYLRSEIVSGQAADQSGSLPPPIALPRVSVIVTCFNYARYVTQALDSVLSQTYQNFDCVVVDDASTDDSALVIERWINERKDSRFRSIRSPLNRGQTASFAVGLAATSGEFIAFLDADDFWFPQFLQRHVEAHLNRDVYTSISCSDMVQVDEERRVLAGTLAAPVLQVKRANADIEQLARIDPSIASLEFFETPTVKYIAAGYSEHLWTGSSGMVLRRSALDLAMPKQPDELRICTDWYIFIICNYFTGSLSIGSALGAYRRHRNNNYANNPVVGYFSSPAASATKQHHQIVADVTLRHLLDHYDRFSTVFAPADVRELVRIFFTKALLENLSIRDPRLRAVLGTRRVLEAKLRARLSFFGRLARWLPFGRGR
jgi:glycosyltransferase involved in cell wall biosynthesis